MLVRPFGTSVKALPFGTLPTNIIGCKTTSLELVGMIIPLLYLGNVLAGQHVVWRVDNIGCYYICNKGYSTKDNLASIRARLISLISAKFAIVLHIQHLPRLSTWEATLVDRLSRKRSTGPTDRKLLDSFSLPPLNSVFRSWMDCPIEDWSLP